MAFVLPAELDQISFADQAAGFVDHLPFFQQLLILRN
jgi:hypothetical protein